MLSTTLPPSPGLPPLLPHHSVVLCVTSVFLIKLLRGGFHPNRSIFYISWQQRRAVNNVEQANKTHETGDDTHLHSPGSLQVPCSTLHPCLQIAFGRKKQWKVCVNSRSFHQNHVLIWHLVFQVIKSLKSHFPCLCLREIWRVVTTDGKVIVGANWRCLPKVSKHSWNSCEATLDMNFDEPANFYPKKKRAAWRKKGRELHPCEPW